MKHEQIETCIAQRDWLGLDCAAVRVVILCQYKDVAELLAQNVPHSLLLKCSTLLLVMSRRIVVVANKFLVPPQETHLALEQSRVVN